jgi:hypothetical protein
MQRPRSVARRYRGRATLGPDPPARGVGIARIERGIGIGARSIRFHSFAQLRHRASSSTTPGG